MHSRGEDGLGRHYYKAYEPITICLNPYCSGRWSRTKSFKGFAQSVDTFLILIVVEDGLVPILQCLTENGILS